MLTHTTIWLIFTLFATKEVCGDIFAQQKNRSRRPLLSPVTSSRERKPNIVLILTDDQDVELGSLNFMPKTLRAVRDRGAEFRHAYVTTPMCCPSRSSLLTGMYVHNHNVYTNNDNCSSTLWQATHETRSFATYLSNAGYRTGYFGKYLNKYNGSYIPPGWREWGGLIMNSKFYNYSINMNGKKIKHGFDYQKDYYSDVITNDSIAFLRQSKKNSAHKPVMLTMSFPAPHGPEDSAPQYSHLFFNVTTHHTPSYDYAPNPDKQWILQVTKKMQPIHKQFTDLLMTKRLQTLQSVDSAVQRVVEELEALGELDNTYIVYTSDHGYHLGQFGLIKGKSFPFEFDVRVPFLVRGPGVEPGTVVDDIVLNIDLAPTFLDMAGVEAPSHMDGRSVLPLFLNSKRKRLRWPDTFLIESSGRREIQDLKKIRNPVVNLTFIHDLDEISSSVSPFLHTTTMKTEGKMFDSTEDLEGDDDDGEIVEEVEEEDEDEELEETEEPKPKDSIDELFRGAETNIDNQLSPQLPHVLAAGKLERLAVECLQEEFQLPCQPEQKWYCQHEFGRWRKHKCKLQIPIPAAKKYKKCACFTPEGVVYRKIALNTTTILPRKHPRNARVKRNIVRDEILFRKVRKEHFREKRDTLRHVDTEMENIKNRLNGLEAANASLPQHSSSLDSNAIFDTTPGCVILRSGKINCSTVIYHDRKTWRQSRHYIDNEIQKLRQKLDNLKEIRRHLKQSRPISSLEDEEEISADRTDSFNFNQLNVNLEPDFGSIYIPPVVKNETIVSTTETTTRASKKRKKQPDDETKPKRRKIKVEFTVADNVTESENTSVDFDIFNTSTTTVATSNHHRHHHKHKHHNTTQKYKVESTIPYKMSTVAPTRIRSTTLKPIGSSLDTETNNEYCACEVEEPQPPSEKDLLKEAKRKQKEVRMKKRERKQRKKAKLEKECLSEKMNCFSHDNDHWRTAPLWTSGPFCFCMNANNNTYSCVRTINSTHNLLYCEFTTGLVTYYNLRIDPFELQNRIDQLKPEEKSYLHDQLSRLRACRGRSCNVSHNSALLRTKSNLLPLHSILVQSQRPKYHKKRKLSEDFTHMASKLPLTQSEFAPHMVVYNSHTNKSPRRWRRRKTWSNYWSSNQERTQRRERQTRRRYNQ